MNKQLPQEVYLTTGHVTQSCIAAMSDAKVRIAIKYVSPTLVVKATRRPHGTVRHQEFMVTFGRPNYRERRFVARCQKAGEPFPVRKLQLILKARACA